MTGNPVPCPRRKDAPDTLDSLELDDETVFVDAALDDPQKVNLSLQCVLKTV